MAQITKIIDVTRSFLPMDPDAFPQNMMYTEQTDSPEKEPPILAIEGQNFMPTSYGYKSFFGQNSTLASTPLPVGTLCDKVLLFQFSNYKNALIALCADGIYVNTLGSWIHEISLTPPAAGVILEWTHALIENTLYLYRQGNASVYSIDYTGISVGNFPVLPLSFARAGFSLGLTGEGTIATPYVMGELVTSRVNWIAIAGNPTNPITVVITGAANPALISTAILNVTTYDTDTDTITDYPVTAGLDGSVSVTIPAQRIDLLRVQTLVTAAHTLELQVIDSLGEDTVTVDTPGDIVTGIRDAVSNVAPLLGRGFATSPYTTTLVDTSENVGFYITGGTTSMTISTTAAVTVTIVLESGATVDHVLAAGTSQVIPISLAAQADIYGGATSANISLFFTNPASYNITINTITPTFLNMAGQMGIFRANGRLGFWDSANSISWSSLFDPMDQTPSLETLAGNAIFNAIVGRIVHVLPKGDGFVIYATKSIVGVRYSNTDNILWDASSITNEAGIAFPSQVTTGITDQDHFAFTNSGIKKIGAYNQLAKTHAMEDALADLYDFLKESRSPVRLDLINGRYLLFSLIDVQYLTGRTMFSTVVEDSVTFRVLLNSGQYDGSITLPVYVAAEDWVYNSGGTPLVPSTLIDYTGALFALSPFSTFTRTVTQWRAQGEKMIPSAPLTPADPYNLNISTYVHTPNIVPVFDVAPTRASLASIVQNSETSLATKQAAFVTLLSTSAKTPQVSLTPSYKELGWVFPRNGVEGVMDRNLHEYLYYQHLEWEYYATYQTSLANSIGTTPILISTTTTDLGILTYAEAVGLEIPVFNIEDVPQDIAPIEEHLGYLYTAGPSYTPVNNIPYYSATIAPVDIGFPNWEIGARNSNYKATKTATYSVGKETIISHSNSYSVKHATEGVSIVQYYIGSPVIASMVSQGYQASSAIACGKEAIDLLYSDSTRPGLDAILTQKIQEIYAMLPSNFEVIEIATGEITRGLLGAVSFTPYSAPGDVGLTATASVNYTWASTEVHSTVNIAVSFIEYVHSYAYLPLTTQTFHIVKTDTSEVMVKALDNIPAESQLVSNLTAYQDSVSWSYIRAAELAYQTAYPYLDGAYSIPAIDIAAYLAAPTDLSLTYPGATFTMQDGSLAPYYPTYKGALVLDLGLKKWGKMVADFKTLVDYQPINQAAGVISYTNFSFDIGILNADRNIVLFDSEPASSWITYGKAGYYRQGMTQLEEVRAHFRRASTGEVIVMPSLDGRALSIGWEYSMSFTNVGSVISYPTMPGSWYAIKISGNYDLTYLELRGTVAGRR